VGATTQAAGAPTIAGQTPPEIPQNHPMVLQYQLAYVKHTLQAATLRKERLEDLMQRRGAKKWDAAKKATMVRRLVAASQTVEQCVAAVDELTKKLEQVLAQLPQQNPNPAPFIKAPPTSEMPASLFDQPTLTTPAPTVTSPEIESPFGS